jgi:hypothetical protein
MSNEREKTDSTGGGVSTSVEVLSKIAQIVVAAAALVLTYAAYSFQREFQRAEQQRSAQDRLRDASQQIRAKYANLEAARRAYEAQATQHLIAIVTEGTEEKRRMGLRLMAQIAPRLAADFSIVLWFRSPSASERRFAQEIHEKASDLELGTQFRTHVGMAREFFSSALYRDACEEYVNAWNRLPREGALRLVPEPSVRSGAQHCFLVPGSVKEGAEELQEAFRKIQTQ